MKYYLDASAASKLLVVEAETQALEQFLNEIAVPGALVSSLILETELRRLAVRLSVPQSNVTELLDRFDLLDPDRALVRDAGLLAGAHLRALDALHVATALRLNATFVLTYDERQARAAMDVGLRVLSIGDSPQPIPNLG